MKLNHAWLNNRRKRFEIVDTNGRVLFVGLALVGVCTHHDDNGRETYSFMPYDAESGACIAWVESTEILKIEKII